MFQAINDGEVSALQDVLKEQSSQLNSVKTVTTILVCSLNVCYLDVSIYFGTLWVVWIHMSHIFPDGHLAWGK